MIIEEWPTDRPKPYATNPRIITPEAIEKVAASIKAYGFQQPIVVDASGVVIVGHTRLMAARLLEMQTVPVVVANGLSKEKVQAYRIADNRVNQESDWNAELLAIEMREVGDLFTGFNPGEKISGDDGGSSDAEMPSLMPMFELGVSCRDTEHMNECFEKLTAQGFNVRVIDD